MDVISNHNNESLQLRRLKDLVYKIDDVTIVASDGVKMKVSKFMLEFFTEIEIFQDDYDCIITPIHSSSLGIIVDVLNLTENVVTPGDLVDHQEHAEVLGLKMDALDTLALYTSHAGTMKCVKNVLKEKIINEGDIPMKSDVSNISNSLKVSTEDSEFKLPEFIKISFRGNKAGNGNIIESGELVGDICDKSFLDGKIVESMDMEPLSADLDNAELVGENISEIKGKSKENISSNITKNTIERSDSEKKLENKQGNNNKSIDESVEHLIDKEMLTNDCKNSDAPRTAKKNKAIHWKSKGNIG